MALLYQNYQKFKQSVTVDASGNAFYDFGGPSGPNGMWLIGSLQAAENLPANPVPQEIVAVGSAGAQVSVTTPFFTPWLTGFDVSIQPSTAAGLCTVTVTGSLLNTLTYYLEESTTSEKNLSIRYPYLIPQTTVTASAVASGGIVSVSAFGLSTASPALVTWFGGTNPNNADTAPSTNDLLWHAPVNSLYQSLPQFSSFNQPLVIAYPEHLMFWASGGLSGEIIHLIAMVQEFA